MTHDLTVVVTNSALCDPCVFFLRFSGVHILCKTIFSEFKRWIQFLHLISQILYSTQELIAPQKRTESEIE